MTIEEVIMEFINQREIKPGMYFDSHAVIDYIIKYHEDVYHAEQHEESVESYHGIISLKVQRFSKENLITDIGRTFSKNTRGYFSECALWQKL